MMKTLARMREHIIRSMENMLTRYVGDPSARSFAWRANAGVVNFTINHVQ